MKIIRNENKSIIGLLGCTCINSVLYMFLNTFMVAYFITLTNYDYRLISVYYIITFIFIMLSFLFLGRIVKNKSQVVVFRIGIIMYCAYILLIALLKEKIVNYYILLGSFYGIVQGFFWLAGHSLITEYTKDEANNFVSLKSILSKILKIIVPFILGISIEVTSFSYIAKIILILSIIQFSFSLLIKDKVKVNTNKYNLKDYILYIKGNNKFKYFYKLIACDGIINYLFDTLITILIVMTFKTALNLGILTTIFSIFSILSVYIFQRKLSNNKNIIKISTVLMFISTIFLLVDINKFTIIIYNLFYSVSLILLINKAETKRYEIVNEDKKVVNNYLVEHQVMSEVCLNVSRIIGYIVLFIASLFNSQIVFKLLLFIVTIFIVIYSYLMLKLDK